MRLIYARFFVTPRLAPPLFAHACLTRHRLWWLTPFLFSPFVLWDAMGSILPPARLFGFGPGLRLANGNTVVPLMHELLRYASGMSRAAGAWRIQAPASRRWRSCSAGSRKLSIAAGLLAVLRSSA